MLCLRDHIFESHSTSSTSLFKPCSAESVIYSLYPVSIYHLLYPLCRVHCKREMYKPFFIQQFCSLLFSSYICIFPQLDVLPKLETTLYEYFTENYTLKLILILSRINKYAHVVFITHTFMCNGLFMPRLNDTLDNAYLIVINTTTR